MPIASQVRLLRALRAILAGEGAGALPQVAEPKPSFVLSHKPTPLPRSTPEAEGISSALLEKLYREVANTPGAGAHSLTVLRHGKVISEGYFAPYRPDVWHVTHSLCKTFTGTAVGLAIHEGFFKLDDPIVQFFPEEAGARPSKRLRAVTVRHLLTMSSGFAFNEVEQAVEPEWVKSILASNITFEPGSRFLYNSMNSYLLSALVQRTSGESLGTFLHSRLFEPMGFGPVVFERSLEGIDKGGWGMYIMPEDMAKFGQLYLQKGRWNTADGPRQLLPASWVKRATKTHIEGPNSEQYGLHLWLDGPDGNTIMNGMFGQYITVLPKLDMVVVMNAGNPYMFTDSPAHSLVRTHLYPLVPGEALPEAPSALRRLRLFTASLRFGHTSTLPQRPLKRPALTPGLRWKQTFRALCPNSAFSHFTDTTWRFKQNNAGILPVIVQVMNNNFTTGIEALQLTPHGPNTLLLLWEEGQETVCLPLGTSHPARSWFQIGRESFEAAAFAELRHDENKEEVLYIQLNLLEHSSTRIIKLRRNGNALHMQLDETPALMVAIETVMAQTQSTNMPDARSDPAAKLLNIDYVTHLAAKLCTPQLTAHPLTPRSLKQPETKET